MSIEAIKKEWFKVSSHKLSDPNQVEDYLSSFNEISKPCLKHIVNLQDDNVRDTTPTNDIIHIPHMMLRLFRTCIMYMYYYSVFILASFL